MTMICKPNDCTGCYACINICPKKCITMKKNDYGFNTAVVLEERCIKCGRCRQVCPVLNEVTLCKPKQVYAAYSKTDKIHNKSASGGIATELALYIIRCGGVVYGAAHTGNLQIRHIRVDKEEDIEKLQGSKYVHSHVELQYQNVKVDLLNDRFVLFIGSPCQVAGLKKYLQVDYEKLYCVDLICHGVPSWSTLHECMVEETGLKSFKDIDITFRDMDGYEIKIIDPNGNILARRNLKNSLYYNGFMEGYIYRSNCYQCRYAQANRCGDITLGDFWGLGAEEKFEEKIENGINALLINTKKGEKIFNAVNLDIKLWKRTLKEAVKGNGQLRDPSKNSKEHKNFEKFCFKYRNRLNGNAKAIKRCNPQKTIKIYVRIFILKSIILKKIMKNIPGLRDKI